MSRIAITLFVFALSTVLLVACSGGSTSTPSPTLGPNPTPISKQLAIQYATASIDPLQFYNNYYEVTAEHLAARDGANVLQNMSLGELGLYSGTPNCPPNSFGCGMGTGVLADSSGWLVLVTGLPEYKSPVSGDPRQVKATWIADRGNLIGFPAVEPTSTEAPNDTRISLERTDWVSKESPSGRTLTLQVGVGGGCQIFARLATSETADIVTIHAYIVSTYHPNAACTDQLKVNTMTVNLDAPLGDRKLVGCDGRTLYPYFQFTDDKGNVDCLRTGP